MTTVSNFFSRDALLKRQVRTSRARKHSRSTSLFSSPSKQHHLHIIPEEETLPRPSSSSCPSPTRSRSTSPVKAKRRHASISASDISIIQQQESVEDDMLLLSPRPAPRPPQTPSPRSSPDSFRLTFTDVAFAFPHPPLPTPSCASPTPSMSSSSGMSSPGSETTGLPTTPGSSDDEFFASPRLRRRSIKPLVIVKHHHGAIATQGLSEVEEKSSPSPVEEEESDGEWYASEFSKILSMCTPAPSTAAPARPDSMSLPPSLSLPPPPRRRGSRRSSTAPPPPVPPIPAHFRSQSTCSDAEFRMSIPPRPIRRPLPPVPVSVPTIVEPVSLPTIIEPVSVPTLSPRPPPKSAVPTDEDDALSEFSLSLYTGEETPSVYSQFSAPASASSEEVDFEVDVDFEAPLMLPLSLPGSPIDFEKDVVWEVRRRLGEVTEEAQESKEENEQVEFKEDPEELKKKEKKKEKRRPIQLDVFVPSPCSSSLPRSPSPERSSYSLSPALSSYSSSASHQRSSPNRVLLSPMSSTSLNSSHSSSFSFPSSIASQPQPQHVLRSKWSSSTLNEEPSTAKKLRAFLSPSSTPPKHSPKKPSTSASAKVTPWEAAAGPTRQWNAAARYSRDVMVIGFDRPVPPTPTSPSKSGLRRRGSTMSASSEVSSCDSSCSAGGLRRKPIPVEMFLRA